MRSIYYGDCLEIIKKYIPDSSLDLVYLDPPWKSDKPYNIIFREPTGELPEAQIQAFDDTWHWSKETHQELQYLTSNAPSPVVKMLKALLDFLGRNDVTAYLVMICSRLLQIHRVMKNSASLFFHCDPVMSHYIKVVLDSIFGKYNYRNEIVWCYTGREHPKTKVFPWRHQTILFYTKSVAYREKFNPLFRPYDPGYVNLYFDHLDEDGRKYQIQPDGKGGRYKQYLDESPGIRVPDWWEQKRNGIKPLHGKDMYTMHRDEEYFYPTQKTVKLLELIIESTTKEGDVVLDPFCGCVTALIASQLLHREWIGIDITYCAVDVMKYRLNKAFPGVSYDVVGEPLDLRGAMELARHDSRQFQMWAVSKIGGRPSDKESWDRGIDGYCFFLEGDQIKEVVVQVKSGHLSLSQVRDFSHVVEREESDAGVFLTLKNPSHGMEQECLERGFFVDLYGNEYPKVQILTVDAILKGKQPELPPFIPPYDFRATVKKEKSRQSTFS